MSRSGPVSLAVTPARRHGRQESPRPPPDELAGIVYVHAMQIVDRTAPPPIDPECQQALSAMPIDFAEVLGGLSDESLAAVRRQFATPPDAQASGAVEWADHDIPQRSGVRVRVYRPTMADRPRPCIYWMHGGGLVLGSYTDDGSRFERWCATLDCVGVSVDYRLAPEHPYPVPLDDCLAGLRWVHDHAEELGVDRTRIGLGGASAGGGLAAGLALRMRDDTDLVPALQLLIYPMLDDRQLTTSSRWRDRIWPPAANRYAWSSYLGDLAGSPDVPPSAAPARSSDLTGLPPTYIVVGTADPFVDEDVEHANRLRAAGVEVDLHVYNGAFHGFDVAAAGTRLAQRANRDLDDWLRSRL